MKTTKRVVRRNPHTRKKQSNMDLLPAPQPLKLLPAVCLTTILENCRQKVETEKTVVYPSSKRILTLYREIKHTPYKTLEQMRHEQVQVLHETFLEARQRRIVSGRIKPETIYG